MECRSTCTFCGMAANSSTTTGVSNIVQAGIALHCRQPYHWEAALTTQRSQLQHSTAQHSTAQHSTRQIMAQQ
jgi:hypothetical protein